MLMSFCSINQLTDVPWQNRVCPEPKAVHLWGVTLDGTRSSLGRCGDWLDEYEQARAARLVREEDRWRYVLAHGGLRLVLSRYLGIGPAVVKMCRSETGKPALTKELEGQFGITFNLSHAHGRALIAISKGQEVGVDLERIRSEVEVEKLSQRYFAPSEHATIMQLTQEQRAARFFRLWVAKEAALKAEGIGLLGLSQCEIVLGADGIDAEVLAPVRSPLEESWKVCFLSCGEGWEAAVAAQGIERVVPCGLVQ